MDEGSERDAIDLERLEAEIGRLNELFALRWDATQSAETAVKDAEIERLLAALKQIEKEAYCGWNLANEQVVMVEREDGLSEELDVFVRKLVAKSGA